MAWRLAILSVLLSAPLDLPLFAQNVSPERFLAVLRDGTVLRSNALQNFADPARNPHLDGRDLQDRNNPVRLLRDSSLPITPRSPYLEFSNGDILPGKVILWEPDESDQSRPARLLIAPLATDGQDEILPN